MSTARDLERAANKFQRKDIEDKLLAPSIIVILREDGTLDKAMLEKLFVWKKSASKVFDLFDSLLMELMLVDHPEYKLDMGNLEGKFAEFRKQYAKGADTDVAGCWVLYSDGSLLHLLLPDDHYKVRTSRNLGLLSASELARVKQARIAVGGLSVGGLCATLLAMEGITNFYLTDFDLLALSNLNRLQSSLKNIGVPKTAIIAEKLWDIDPFINIAASNAGYCEETEREIFSENNKPDVFIEAMDSLDAKVASREACRRHRVPLVWMIDMGDGLVQIGTERYDLDPNYPAFHGNLQRVESNVGRKLDYVESCFAIFNNDRLPYRMAVAYKGACESAWPGIPQLAGTVSIAGGAIAKTVRKILLGEAVIPEYFIEVDEMADADYKQRKNEDRERTHELLRSMSLIN